MTTYIGGTDTMEAPTQKSRVRAWEEGAGRGEGVTPGSPA